jgi:serine/threonine-protein kinase
MSTTPDSTQSNEGQPAEPMPFSEVPLPKKHFETVVHPDRHGTSPSPAGAPSSSGSSIWQKLFPPEAVEDGEIPQADATGIKLEHFVIEERIGLGGMGAVFRAVDQRLQRIVALKVLAPGPSRETSSIHRFENEARAAARLDHDNIARVFYVGAEGGLFFIAYEFVTGTNIRDLIRETGQLDPRDAVNYTLQIATALNHTAAAGVIHRDIKPSNIIVTPSGRAKLVDMGLARKEHSSSTSDLTLAGTTLGTFDYISPEQAKDPRNVDVRSDIYSLGCTLYHMLAGEPPYPEGTVLQKLLDHQGKEPPDPTVKNRRVSAQLSAIVKRMMASDPRRRYATPDQLIHDLMHVAGSLGLRGINPEGLVWLTPRIKKTRFWEKNLGWLLAAAALLLIVFASEWIPRLTRESQNLTENRENSPRVAQPAETAIGLGTSEGGVNASGATNSVASDRNDMVATDLNSSASATGAQPNLGNQATSSTEPGEHGAAAVAKNGTNETSRAPSATPPTQDPARRSPNGDDKVFGKIDLLSKATFPTRPKLDPTRPRKTGPPVPTGRYVPPPPAAALPGNEAAASTATDQRAHVDGSVRPPIAHDQPPPIAIVAADGERARPYPTLWGACAAAVEGDIIELSYDGRRSAAPEKPLRITKEITVRAGKKETGQRYRPLIEFALSDEPAEAETRMIRLLDGSLDLVNVDVLVQVNAEIDTDLWALFSLQGTETVRLAGTTVTFRNAERRNASIFELVAGTGPSPSRLNQIKNAPSGIQREFEIEVDQSFLRGGCDLFVVKHTRPGRIEIDQSVVAIDGTLLNLLGDLDMPPDSADLELELEHVTCLTGNGLVRIDGGDEAREMLPVHVSARNNIFAATEGNPLIAMTGNAETANFRELLRWSGAKNFYDRLDTFWSIAPGVLSAEPVELDFEAWKETWGAGAEVDADNSGIVWRKPWRVKNRSEITSADLELDHVTTTPSAFESTDDSDVGADLTHFLYALQTVPSAQGEEGS